MRGGASGIAHIVQTVEERYEIQPGRGEILGRADLEHDVVGDAMRGGVRVRRVDRRGMEIVSDELRVRERLRHRDGRPAVAASDIGDLGAAWQLLDDAVERG